MPSTRWLRASWDSARPVIDLVLRTSAAAGLSWIVARMLPIGGAYPYYAPLGAVVATSVTITASLRETVRAFVAIVLGAVIALATGAVLPASTATVVLVVALGVVVAQIPWLGDMGPLGADRWVVRAAAGQPGPGRFHY